LLAFCSPEARANADSNLAPAPSPADQREENLSSNDMLRAYLQLQEQIHATQLSVDRTRQESADTAARNAEALSNRLQLIEQFLVTARARELETVQSTNRAMLTIAGAFVGVGLLALVLTAYLHWRAVHRLAEIAATLSAGRALAPLAALGAGDNNHFITAGTVDPSTVRLLGVIERLEKRLLEFENGAPADERAAITSDADSSMAEALPETSTRTSANPAFSSPNPRLAMLLGKGQSLLSLDKIEEALACFDEVLTIDPNNTEALVKKGLGLEKLRKPQEAIECYDRAIAADNTLTIAYLYKGGLYNRMERFGEAMQCYEQALHTQEKRRAA
jgi:tetratricopeptide (TPR) repeat protein